MWLTRAVSLFRYLFESTPVKYATFWALSSENLHNRTQKELDYLFEIYKIALDEVDELLSSMKISLRWIWSKVWLPENLIKTLKQRVKKHTYETWRALILGVNYGWRDEIIRGVQKLYTTIQDEGLEADAITENDLSDAMDLWDIPPVDLVIRTKWHRARRLSWFMTWWVGYAELYFTSTLFPDVDSAELDKALAWYDSIVDKRNFWE